MKSGTYYEKHRIEILARLKQKYHEDAEFRAEVNLRNIKNYRKIMADENLANERREQQKLYMREYNKRRKEQKALAAAEALQNNNDLKQSS